LEVEMKVLVVGSGGREHAIAWALARSMKVEKVYVAPGNGGTEIEHKCTNVPIKAEAVERLAEFFISEGLDFAVVGPEGPLAAGIVDYFMERGLLCLGPTKKAAMLESSKAFAKEFMARHGIPTARFQVFESAHHAMEFAKDLSFPVVIKADGLAGGKGVIIAKDEREARDTIEGMLDGRLFGEAGKRVVVEEYLQGQEASFIVITDGKEVIPLATSQDHKALEDGDKGPNTGGMGAYSPTKLITPQLFQEIQDKIIWPTIKGMEEEGAPYKGFLYAGLMIADGRPYVLEFNCRLGDPEAQPILLRFSSDFSELCLRAIKGELKGLEVQWDERHALGVVMASKGYPFKYQKGYEIKGLGEDPDYVKVFHAGTRREGNRILTDGGRVLCVTALGRDLWEAKERAYQRVKEITWEGCYYRSDIGDKGMR
jgi:phosphoribosylamine--glycine ligase